MIYMIPAAVIWKGLVVANPEIHTKGVGLQVLGVIVGLSCAVMY